MDHFAFSSQHGVTRKETVISTIKLHQPIANWTIELVKRNGWYTPEHEDVFIQILSRILTSDMLEHAWLPRVERYCDIKTCMRPKVKFCAFFGGDGLYIDVWISKRRDRPRIPIGTFSFYKKPWNPTNHHIFSHQHRKCVKNVFIIITLSEQQFGKDVTYIILEFLLSSHYLIEWEKVYLATEDLAIGRN